jgi:PAS domain S-box-containing protein/putative nucleotidyltransferase with HDIG domain
MSRSGKTAKPSSDEQSKSQPDSAVKSGGGREGVQRRPINFLHAAVVLAVIVVGINLWEIFFIKDQELRTGLSDVIPFIVDLLVSIVLFIAAKYSAVRSKRLAIAWGTIALAILFYSLGDAVWLILEVGLKVEPSPSLADGFYLFYYPAFLVGTFLLLEKPATTGLLINRVLDMGIILGSAIIGFWGFLIGPLVSSNAGQPLLEQWILFAYPVGDLVLLGALLLIIYNPLEHQEKTPIYFLAGSLLVTIVADSIYTYQSLLGTYVSGGFLDLSWIVASLLAGLAGASQVVSIQSTHRTGKTSLQDVFQDRLKTLQPYVPYFWLAAVFVLLVRRGMGFTPISMGFLSLSLAVGGIIVLVIIRQIIALTENNKLNSRLQKSMDRIQVQSTELEKTNLELELDITGRKQAEAALQQSEALFRALFELSPDAIVLIDPHDPDASWPIVDCNAAACLMNGYTRAEMVGQSIDIVNMAPYAPAERTAYMEHLQKGGIYKLTTQHRRKDGTVFFVDVSTILFTLRGRELILGIDHDITERNRREEEIKHRLAELEAINKVSSDLRAAQTLEEILPLLLDTILEVMHAAQGSIWLYDPIKDELDPVVTRGFEAQTGMPPLPSVKPGAGIAGRVFASGQPYVSGDFQLYPNLSKTTRQLIPPGIGGAAIPIRAEENILGTIIVNVPFPRELTPDEVHLLTTLSEIAGIAIRRTSLRQQTDRRLRHLTALSEINRAITSSVDLHLNLTMLLNQVIAQLDIDAADVLLLNPILRTLDYAAGSGFRTRTVERAHQRMDEGYAGRAVMERHILYIPNLVERDDNPLIAKTLAGEAFVSYYAVPLLAKGQIKGVLEIFHRVPHEHDTEWLDFLNTLAEQAAIAIDNVTLFDNLQRSNVELVLAYDATIEGWSRALDLRDKETEGHTQRVADITVRLARTFSLSEAELVQVRWGALLHDIGKMGVPDEILLKPGPLTDDEWVIMKKHPVLAYEMLSPIHYLRSALDIPYHHHEKWDGTGYPLGLKGEQIPLTARIFAVVDVWDALRSDRPYRKGWSDEKAREHIRSLAGTHFDPKAVEVFLNAMSENA